jgi:hypothetical protein
MAFDSAKAEARKKLAEAVAQYGFVRANWGKLSTITVGAIAIGFLAGAVFF